MKLWRGVIEEYRDFLPVTDKTPVVTLFEGNTPLVPAPRLAEATDARMQIYLKCEGFNPTGSFKDRGMTVAISKALETGSRAVICASTGNTSASAAAFAARAGIRAFVMVPKGSVALGKLSQAAIHGARVLTVEGNSFKYNQEATLGGADFHAVNGLWTEATATFTQKTANLAILGGLLITALD